MKNEAVPSMPMMTQYIYDAEGARVAKGTITNWSAGCDITQNGFVPTNSYVLGLSGEQLSETDGYGNWLHSNAYAAGMLIGTYDTAPTGEQALHFQLEDWLGTRRVQTDISGNLEETFTSQPFGDGFNASAVAGAPATADDATEHHFTGKERDSESGNDYFGARYYASSTGRFLSPDPFLPFSLKEDKFQAWITNPQRWNKYAYALNNPLKYTDPTGMTETIYYYLNSNLTDEQRKFFNDHKDAILGAIAAKLKEAGIKDVVFKDGSALSSSQVKSILGNNPKGVALLNFANTSYGDWHPGSSTFGGTNRDRSVVLMGNLETSDTDKVIDRLGEVGAHELGHGMGFYSRDAMSSFLQPWNRDLMNEGQGAPGTWYDPSTWGERHFDMSIPQNKQAVDDINNLPEYQPQ